MWGVTEAAPGEAAFAWTASPSEPDREKGDALGDGERRHVWIRRDESGGPGESERERGISMVFVQLCTGTRSMQVRRADVEECGVVCGGERDVEE